MFGKSSKKSPMQSEALPKYERLYARPSVELDTTYGLQSDSTNASDDYGDDYSPRLIAHPPPRRPGRVKQAMMAILTLLATLDLCYRAYELVERRIRSEISCNCGDTLTEAVANNCRYDSFAAAWLPPHCRNDALIDAFERAGPNPDGSWNYYADRNKTRRLSLEQVARLPETGGGHFFATHQWHLVHCAYYWKKMFLAPKEGTVIEKRYDNMGHLEHCEMMFLKRDDLDTIVTEAGVSLHSDVAVIAKRPGHEHGDS